MKRAELLNKTIKEQILNPSPAKPVRSAVAAASRFPADGQSP
jgi:hypothetical protein